MDKFNNYAKENGLNIKFEITSITPSMSMTDGKKELNTIIKSLLKKKSSKYDIYFYDNVYSSNYSNYFLDLYEYLPKSHLDMYNDDIITNLCVYNNHLIGLVTIIYLFIILYLLLLNLTCFIFKYTINYNNK